MFCLTWSHDAVLGVVAASKGYPGAYEKKKPIVTLPEAELLFCAGMNKTNDHYETAGGRVLLVAEKAANLRDAKNEVYRKLEELDTEYLFYRTDIGDKAIKRLK